MEEFLPLSAQFALWQGIVFRQRTPNFARDFVPATYVLKLGSGINAMPAS